jgi:hypothetical protein
MFDQTMQIAMPLECFWFGKAFGAIMFVMATVSKISCCQGRRYEPVLSLSFFEAYDSCWNKDKLSTGSCRLTWQQEIFEPVAIANIMAPHAVPCIYI